MAWHVLGFLLGFIPKGGVDLFRFISGGGEIPRKNQSYSTFMETAPRIREHKPQHNYKTEIQVALLDSVSRLPYTATNN